jgi:hypothetical protein
MTDLKSVRIETDEPVAEGTVATGTVRMFGIRVEDPIVITAFEAPRRFAIRHDGLFKGAGEITLEPGADATTTIVRWEEQLVPPALPHLGAALMRPALVNVFQADLHRLRRLIEA